MTNQISNAAEAILPTNNLKIEQIEYDDFAEKWTKFHTGALVGLLGGFIILLGAIFLTVFEYLSGEKSHGFWLFFTIYPLFAIGAHCLDKISELKKQKENISYENTAHVMPFEKEN